MIFFILYVDSKVKRQPSLKEINIMSWIPWWQHESNNSRSNLKGRLTKSYQMDRIKYDRLKVVHTVFAVDGWASSAIKAIRFHVYSDHSFVIKKNSSQQDQTQRNKQRNENERVFVKKSISLFKSWERYKKAFDPCCEWLRRVKGTFWPFVENVHIV